MSLTAGTPLGVSEIVSAVSAAAGVETRALPRIPEFVADSVGRVIYDQRYHYATGSKANRMRGFSKEEGNPTVGKLRPTFSTARKASAASPRTTRTCWPRA